MPDIGKAYVQIIPSTEGIKKELEGQLSGPAQEAGESAGNKIGAFIKKAIAAAGIGKFLKDAIMASADFEQAIGGVETLFRGSADTIKQYANEAYQTAGISATTYMEQVTSFSASLLQSLGGDTAAAAEAANMAIHDMADNSAKMGTDIQSIQNAYQGFAKQNYTMLDNLKLGYGGTKAEMERLLEDATKLSGIEYDISSLDDVYAAIHVVQQEMGIAGVAADEAQTTMTGSFNAMRAAWQNLMAQMGTGGDLSGALSALGSTVAAAVQNFLPTLQNIILGIIPMLSSMIGQMAGPILESILSITPSLISGILAELPTLISAVTDLVVMLCEALPEILLQIVEVISDPTTFQGILDAILASLPRLIEATIQLVMGLIDNLPTIIEMLCGMIPQIAAAEAQAIIENAPAIISGVVMVVAQLVMALPQICLSILNMLGQIVKQTADSIKQAWPQFKAAAQEWIARMSDGIKERWQTMVSNIKSLWSTLVSTVTSLGQQFVSVGSNLVKGLWNGISSGWSWLTSQVKSLATKLLNSVKSALSIHSPSLETKWIGKMFDQGLINGIRGGLSAVTSAAREVAATAIGGVQGEMSIRAIGTNNTASAARDVVGGSVSSDLRNALARLEHLVVVLDSGEVVGGIAAKMDAKLGTNSALAERGLARA